MPDTHWSHWSRRHLLALAVAGVSCALCALPAAGAETSDWPQRTVKIIVPFTPGGTVDLIGRTLAAKMGEITKQAVIVDNRGGASGAIGTAVAIHAAPDGYTLLIGSTSTISIRPRMAPPLGFDVDTGLIPISLAASVPHVIVVNPGLPVHNLKELVQYAKSSKLPISFADGGAATPHHLSSFLLQRALGIDITPISYKGGGEVFNGVIAGSVDAASAEVSTSAPLIASGRLRAIAIAAPVRDPRWPDVATVAEQGIPGFETTSWFGVFTTAGTPAPVVARISQTVREALADPKVRESLTKLGLTPGGGDQAQFMAHLKREGDKWGKVIEQAGVKSTED